MTFNLFLLWSFVLIGRPQDFFVFLQPLRPALLLTVVNVGAVFLGTGEPRISSLLNINEVKKYLLFFIVMIIGIPFAYHRRVAFDFVLLVYLSNILFFLVFLTQVNSLQRLKSFVLITTLCVFFYGFFGLLTGSYIDGRYAIYGGMFDPNDIAYVLVSLFPLSFFFITHRQGTVKRSFAIIAIACALLVILYTGSRGGMLGLLAVLFFLFLTGTGNIKRSYKVVFLALVIIIIMVNSDKIDVERYLSLTDVSSDYNVSDEFGRVQIWERGLYLLLSNPLTGVGVDCFSMALGYARDSMGLIPKWQAAHNSFVQVAVEIGIIGFILFMYLVIRSLNNISYARKIPGTSEEVNQFRTIAGLMYIAYIGQLVSAFFLSQGYSIFFTLFFALSIAMKNISDQLISQPATNESLT